MEEIWASALHQFVVEGGWREVHQFIEENALLFGSQQGEFGEFGEGEHALFLEFRRIASKTLDTLLTDLGCSSAREEEALAAWLSTPRSGPREEMVKALIDDLMSVDNFSAFVKMMRRRNDEIERLEAMKTDRVERMANDEEGEENDEEDWEMQLAVARSIVMAHEGGALLSQDQAYVSWAKAVVKLDECDVEEDPQLYRNLAIQRFNVDLSIAQRSALEERQVRADTARAAVDDERGAHHARIKATLECCDDLQREVAVARGACLSRGTIGDASLELAYLVVKNLTTTRKDLTEHAEDIYDTLAGSSESIVFDLVRWCSLEEELATLRRDLDDILTTENKGDDANGGVWHSFLDSTTNCLYFANSVTGESRWDNPRDEGGQKVVSPPYVEQDEAKCRAEPPTQAEAKKLVVGPASKSEPSSKDTERAPFINYAASQEKAPPPPVGLPSAVLPGTWGRRLSPLKSAKDTDENKQDEESISRTSVNPLSRKAGMILSPIALDFLKKRDVDVSKLLSGRAKESPQAASRAASS